MPLQFIALLVLIPVVIYTELKDGKIYNWLTIPAILLGLMLAALSGYRELIHSLWAMLVAGGIFFVPYLISGLSRGRPMVGGGDVKLAAAIGALTNVGFSLYSIYYAVLTGALIGIAIILWRVVERARARSNGSEVPEGSVLMLRIPFGTALCAGVMITFAVQFLLAGNT